MERVIDRGFRSRRVGMPSAVRWAAGDHQMVNAGEVAFLRARAEIISEFIELVGRGDVALGLSILRDTSQLDGDLLSNALIARWISLLELLEGTHHTGEWREVSIAGFRGTLESTEVECVQGILDPGGEDRRRDAGGETISCTGAHVPPYRHLRCHFSDDASY